jgi:hypothetical protein
MTRIQKQPQTSKSAFYQLAYLKFYKSYLKERCNGKTVSPLYSDPFRKKCLNRISGSETLQTGKQRKVNTRRTSVLKQREARTTPCGMVWKMLVEPLLSLEDAGGAAFESRRCWWSRF